MIRAKCFHAKKGNDLARTTATMVAADPRTVQNLFLLLDENYSVPPSIPCEACDANLWPRIQSSIPYVMEMHPATPSLPSARDTASFNVAWVNVDTQRALVTL